MVNASEQRDTTTVRLANCFFQQKYTRTKISQSNSHLRFCAMELEYKVLLTMTEDAGLGSLYKKHAPRLTRQTRSRASSNTTTHLLLIQQLQQYTVTSTLAPTKSRPTSFPT